MNKKLESLIGRVTTWPQEAQDEAARALAEIEEAYVRARYPLTAEDEAKLADLRETINSSIERGGSYTDEEVAEYITTNLDAWERELSSKT
jgi:uncharacterized protein YbjT (DUF2867 family)